MAHSCRAPVAHTCNPNYSGGRDQEDLGSKPAQADTLQDPISKIPITERAQGEGPEFKSQYHTHKDGTPSSPALSPPLPVLTPL
jgi:hypothetical protein